VCVCEDAWEPRGPLVSQGDAGAQVIVNINASPFHKGKIGERTQMLAERAHAAKSSIVYANMVGAQDELVFDGGSLVIDANGSVVARFPQFKEHFEVVDVPLGVAGPTRHPSVKRIPLTLRIPAPSLPGPTVAQDLGPEQEIYNALKLGLSDYVHKNGFKNVVVGLSGGIDSSLTAAIAADAIGRDAVLGVIMPSEFSSPHSVQDAKELVADLGIEMAEIPITGIYRAYLKSLQTAFGSREPSVAEENVQARIRGNLLMAISNRWGHLVVATGNKSEMACGYATLYGDMAGGFALLKDVFKTEVYALARYRNSISHVIPDNVLTKPPSAELRPNQRDADSLPAYELLDEILDSYIHSDAGVEDIAGRGLERDMVEKVISLVDRAEYKRRQAPPGPKVTVKAFGRDRRLPITNAWREGGQADFPQRVVGEKAPQ
jgi:NAD+ synthase (glutamine-hydrolysing)